MKLQQGVKASRIPLCLQSLLLRTRLEKQDTVVCTILNTESGEKIRCGSKVQRYHGTDEWNLAGDKEFNEERSFFLNYFFNTLLPPSWCCLPLPVPTPWRLSWQAGRLLLLTQGDPCSYRGTARLQGLNERTVQSGVSSFKFNPQNISGGRVVGETIFYPSFTSDLLPFLNIFTAKLFFFGRNPFTMHLKIMLYVLP